MKKLSFSFTIASVLGLLILSSYTAILTVNAQASKTTTTEWQLAIDGLVGHPLNLTLNNIIAMPATTVEATIYCVNIPTQVVASGSWTGVKLATLLEQAGVLPSAIKIAFHASDGFATDLDLETATRANVILAYEKDDTPLSETLRLVVPGKWGYKWISQVTSITLVNYDFKGTYESQGYSDDAAVQSSTNQPSPQSEPTAPSPSAQLPSNSSTTLPAQDTQNSKPEPQPQASESFPTAWIASGIAVIVVSACLLAYVKKRHHQPASVSNPRGC